MEEVCIFGNPRIGSRFGFFNHQEFGRTTGVEGSGSGLY
jgi:hypothetical protein